MSAPVMLTFSLTAQGTLAAESIGALLRSLHPNAIIRHSPRSEDADWPGIMVRLEGSGRWLYISNGNGPDAAAAKALASGACSVVSLASRGEDFARAVEALVSGESSFVPLEMVRWMAGELNGRDGADKSGPEPAIRLTAREREVLSLVAMGCSNMEIGEALTISPNTVRSHLHALSVKLDAPSRMKMLARARALGLAEAAGHDRVATQRPNSRIPA